MSIDVPALSVRGLTHAYGRAPSVRGVDFDVAAGEVLCLVGPSGCGKSTTLRMIAGLERPTGGEIRLKGAVVANGDRSSRPESRNVGLMFQDFALFPHLTILDNIAFGLRRRSTAQRRDRALAMAGLVGLTEMVDRHPHQLSGGQQQRAALARALAPNPSAMLLDEPFSSLDATLRADLRADALAVLREADAPVVFVTHDGEEALLSADRLAVMRGGRIEQIGAPEEIYFHPVNAFVAGFFGQVNRFEGVARGGLVDTPLGAAPAPGCADGAPVEVLVRPEAIRLGDLNGEGAEGRVRDARVSRSGGIVRVDLPAPGGECCLECRVFGQPLPPRGDSVKVGVDRARFFVFPRGDSGDLRAA